MKSHVAPYETAVKCLRIVCTNGVTVRLTRYPFDLVMSNSQVYASVAGVDFSTIANESSFAAGAIDLTGFVGIGGITQAQIQSGVFDGADCYLFACDYLFPVEDYEPLIRSVMGKTTLEDGRFRIEEIGIVDRLSQSVGLTHTAPCPKFFGGQEFGGCGISLATKTVTGAVTSVSSSLVFVDSSRAEAADFFGWGTVQFTSGQNAGLRALKVRAYSSGSFTLYEPPYYPLTGGEDYTAVAGCRQRLEDCRDKHNNVQRFGGFPWVPLGSTYRKIPN